MKAKRIGNFFIVAGSLCLLSCLFYYLWLDYDDNKAFNDSFAVVEKLQTLTVPDDPQVDTDDITDPVLTSVEVDGVRYVGYLTIPSADVVMAVSRDPDDEWLKFALCRYYGSPYTNDLVICGHNYKSGFGKIKDLEEGDKVYFTDMKGNVTAYEVEFAEVLPGTDVNGMITSGYDLSLYTSTYGGGERYTVRCTEVPL